MGEGTTRVVEADGMGTRVRALGDEITQVRRWLNALVTELDRRRHNATDLKHLAREHAGAVAAGALVLVALIATPVALARMRRQRQRRWSYRGAELADRTRRLGRALGRVVTDPDRLAPPPPPRRLGIAPTTLASVALTAAQVLAGAVLEWRRRQESRSRL
jgi:hypothetical protein